MQNLDMLVGDTVVTPLADHFDPRNCVEFAGDHSIDIFAATSADPAAVAVSIAADLTTLTIAAVDVADSVRVKVWTLFDDQAAIGRGPRFFHEFFVQVRPPSAGR